MHDVYKKAAITPVTSCNMESPTSPKRSMRRRHSLLTRGTRSAPSKARDSELADRFRSSSPQASMQHTAAAAQKPSLEAVIDALRTHAESGAPPSPVAELRGSSAPDFSFADNVSTRSSAPSSAPAANAGTLDAMAALAREVIRLRAEVETLQSTLRERSETLSTSTRRIIEYEMVQVKNVSFRVAQGWEPQGGVAFCKGVGYQAVVLCEYDASGVFGP